MSETNLKSLLYGGGGPRAACHGYVKRRRFVRAVTPEGLGAWHAEVWRACATGDGPAMLKALQRDDGSGEDYDIGELIELFALKSHVYNFDVLYRQACHSCATLSDVAAFCALRRLALEALVEFGKRWLRSSSRDDYPTNIRPVRLVVACGAGLAAETSYLLGQGHQRPDSMRQMCLYEAVRAGNALIVKMLLAHPDVDCSRNESSVLITAAGQANLQVFLLIAERPELDFAEAGLAAFMTAIADCYAGYALRLLNDERWPAELLDPVVTLLADMRPAAYDLEPLLRAVLAKLRILTDNARMTAADARQMTDRIRALSGGVAAAAETAGGRAEIDEQTRHCLRAELKLCGFELNDTPTRSTGVQ